MSTMHNVNKVNNATMSTKSTTQQCQQKNFNKISNATTIRSGMVVKYQWVSKGNNKRNEYHLTGGVSKGDNCS